MKNMPKLFGIAAAAAAIAFSAAACMNPSDGTAFGGGGPAAPAYAALVGVWGDPPVLTLNAGGTGYWHNPTPILWTATATSFTITSSAGGEGFTVTAGWAILGNALVLSNPTGSGAGSELVVIMLTEAGALPNANRQEERRVLFDLAEALRGAEIADDVGNGLFSAGGMPLVAAGNPRLDVIAGGSGRALRVTPGQTWGEGIDLRDASFGFAAGDAILITGENAGGMVMVNRRVGNQYSTIGGVNTERHEEGPFEIEFELADIDVIEIWLGIPSGLRLESRPGWGGDPGPGGELPWDPDAPGGWNGAAAPSPADMGMGMVVHNIRVTGARPAGWEAAAPPPGDAGDADGANGDWGWDDGGWLDDSAPAPLP